MTVTINGTTGITSPGGDTSTSLTTGSLIPTGSTVPTNGIYLPTTNTVGIATNSTAAVAVDSSQNVGIGTATPAEKLSVGSTSNRGNVKLISSDGGGISMQTGGGTGGSGTAISFYDADTSYAAQIKSSKTSGTNTASLVFSTANGSASFTENMRIRNEGTLCLGTTGFNAGYAMNVLAGQGIYLRGTVNPWNALVFDNSSAGLAGYVQINGTTTSYFSVSDYRLKENVTPIKNGLETVSKLKPVDYIWKTDGVKGQGFIAHELQEVFPQAVSGTKDDVDQNGDPRYQAIDTSFLVAALASAIQELNGKVEAQAIEISALKAGK